jgi:elongation factor Ts
VSFTAKDVMALREKTGLGMMDCKKALKENGGDSAAAEEWLRERVKGKMETRTERATGEGRIGIAVEGDAAVICEVQTETDFTAKNEQFGAMVAAITTLCMGHSAGDLEADDAINAEIDKLRLTTRENMGFARGVKLEGAHYGQYLHHDGKRGVLIEVDAAADDELLKHICQHILFHDPLGISEEDVPAEQIQTIRDEAIAEAQEAGKPEEIAQKIAEGKVRKYLEERTLMHQKFIHDDTKSVKDIIPSGVTIKRFIRYTLGG